MSAPYAVQVIPHSELGGMQQVAYLLDEGLPAEGIDSAVVDLRAVRSAAAGPALVRRLPLVGPTLSVLGLWRSLRRQWRARRPDAVIAHSVLNAVLSLAAARSAGVRRRVVVVHASRVTVGQFRAPMLRALARTGLATDIVFCGHASAASFEPLPRPVRRRARVIQNGVRLPEGRADQGAGQSAAGPHLLVAAGRLTASKNLPTLIRAAARATAEVELHLCGAGEDEAELRALAAELHAPVVFRGRLQRRALRELYAVATAFLFATRGEGLPLVLIEAAEAGLPVIVSDLDFNREVMADAAVYCGPDDVAGWAAAIDDVCANPAMAQRLVRDGRARAGVFTAERMVADYAEMIRGSAERDGTDR